MANDLTIQNLLPILTSDKLAEKNVTIFNTTYVGIDFGTSTTAVSIAVLGNNKQPIIVKPIELNQKLTDGAIFLLIKFLPLLLGTTIIYMLVKELLN